MTQRSSEDRDGMMRLSHRLVALHVAGVAILILVVLSSVVWVSAEHNKLALESSESMVRGGIASFRARLRTLVRDYSIWDEAYDGGARPTTATGSTATSATPRPRSARST